MRRQCLGLLLVLVLGGCAAPPPPPPAPVDALRVTPLMLNLTPVYDRQAGVVLAQALVQHYLQGPHYRMSTPLPLARQYRAGSVLHSPDPQRLLVTYQQGRQWGSLAVTAGQGGIISAFRVQQEGEQGYALVLKRVRICLNAGADRAPVWQGQRWAFSPTRPGRFECSGQTNGSLFQRGSGLPGLLGPYVDEGDTVLYDRDWSTLQQVASLLVHQFAHLKVPRIH
ncbi:hypothetical protein [Marinobacterium weihaiense]|uniref:Group 4 capsule polysaccharide lipoprotein gfcB, YjbF n=1 Tax=Marinobacterium weihaiense TaxID=2851016 RepID=A0ABS6MDU6_9GAMM|nr:hypothetical protein [Marinobacterium weihaiense]MBV0933902.1 hypothetical protein [Marinobacterium weihaiense]